VKTTIILAVLHEIYRAAAIAAVVSSRDPVRREKMSTMWFTSDAHFMHERTATEIRGFDTAEEHDDTLVSNFNSVINDGDTVFALGDFSLKKPDAFGKYFRQLKGDWHLISGNHDVCWPGHRDGYKFQKAYMDAGFKSVQPFGRRKIDGNSVMLSHFPYAGDHTEEQRFTQYRLRNEGLVLLHGHTHDSQKISRAIMTLQIHVGLDAWNLMPVSVDQVIHEIRQQNGQ
jgi:calcineurin-like phosphoesterase family protein